jgi:hypothetical protein
VTLGGVDSLVKSWAQALGASVIATKIKTITACKGVDAAHELVGAATATFSGSLAALRDGWWRRTTASC